MKKRKSEKNWLKDVAGLQVDGYGNLAIFHLDLKIVNYLFVK